MNLAAKNYIKTLRLTIIAASFVLACQARATLYDFTFTEDFGGLTTAFGTIDVVGGSAISGSIDVLGGPNSGIYSLLPGSWFPSPLGAFDADNLVSPGSDPFLDVYGLLFTGGSTEINLWGNFSGGGPGSYSLFGYNAVTGYAPQALGTATLTQVPDSGMTLILLGSALIGVAGIHRKLQDLGVS